MTAGMGLRTVGQAAVFLIVARVLGVEAYGAYSAVLALAMTLGGFGGLGASVIMLRETARDAEAFADSWGRTLAALLVTAPPLLIFYFLLAWGLLPGQIDWIAITCIGVAEILFAPITLAAVQAYQGHERIGRAARMVLVPILPRLAVALLLPFALLLPLSARLPVWGVAYLLASTVSAGYALRLLHNDFGLHIELNWTGLPRAVHEGWPFSVGGAALKIYADIDKIMLARLATLEVTGAYSAAYRVVDMAGVPLLSFLTAATPRFFRAGGEGVRGAARYALRTLPLPFFYALVSAILLYALAGWLPFVLGPQFVSAVDVLRWLAWLPVLTLVRMFLQFVVIGSDWQHAAMRVLLLGAALNIALNLWLIPWLSWRGAVLATYAAELTMAVLFVGSLILAAKR